MVGEKTLGRRDHDISRIPLLDYKQITFSEAAIFPCFTRTKQATRAVFDRWQSSMMKEEIRRNSPTESFDGVGGWLTRSLRGLGDYFNRIMYFD